MMSDTCQIHRKRTRAGSAGLHSPSGPLLAAE